MSKPQSFEFSAESTGHLFSHPLNPNLQLPVFRKGKIRILLQKSLCSFLARLHDSCIRTEIGDMQFRQTVLP